MFYSKPCLGRVLLGFSVYLLSADGVARVVVTGAKGDGELLLLGAKKITNKRSVIWKRERERKVWDMKDATGERENF